MCADCHSTNLKKNYDKEANRYATSWSEITVGCEACHGPASVHIELSKQNNSNQFNSSSHYGFDRDLSKAVSEWVYQEGSSTLKPKAIKETQQVKVCAQCHSRRVQLSEQYDHVQGDVFDKYLVSNLTPELYHLDGQIYDEVYVFGSFEQSKMAQKGVTCTNCHEPIQPNLRFRNRPFVLSATLLRNTHQKDTPSMRQVAKRANVQPVTCRRLPTWRSIHDAIIVGMYLDRI